jgi:hypothetical protein
MMSRSSRMTENNVQHTWGSRRECSRLVEYAPFISEILRRVGQEYAALATRLAISVF